MAVPTATPLIVTKLSWKELNRAEQLALKPLAERWDAMDIAHKRKWLVLSRNFEQLSPTEQGTLQRRMTEWVTLSQQQRAQARLNFVESRKLPADQKAAQWQAYQELSREEKRRLAARAPAKTGIASVKPRVQEKLQQSPAIRNIPKITPTDPQDRPPAYAINRNTLLPQLTPEISEESAISSGTSSETPPATSD